MRVPNSAVYRLLATLVVVALIHFARPLAVSAQEVESVVRSGATIQVQARVLHPGAIHELNALAHRIRTTASAMNGRYLAHDERGWIVGWVEEGNRSLQGPRAETDSRRSTPRLSVADLGH